MGGIFYQANMAIRNQSNFLSDLFVKLITVSGVSGSSLIPQEDSGVSGGGGRSGSKFSFKLSAGLGLQLLLQNNKE